MNAWTNRRRLVAAMEAVVILGLPFVTVGGQSALRFDLQSLKLHVFGATLWVNEFFLVLMATLFVLAFLVAVTNVLGRIWCGWLCPQTVLTDFAADLVRAVFKTSSATLERIVLLPVTALVALSCTWYFVPPAEALTGLLAGTSVRWFFLALWGGIYLITGIMNRTFCRTICPYAMLQSGLFDKDTLVVAFDESRAAACMGCDKCARVCPMGIDIKDGLSRKCIACARCIDACVSMTSRKGVAPFVSYRGVLRKPRTVALFGLSLVLGVAVLALVLMRGPAELNISRQSTQRTDGVNAYHYALKNKTAGALVFSVSVNEAYRIIGPDTLTVAPHAVQQGSLMIRPVADTSEPVRFEFRSGETVLRREAGFL